MLFLAALLLPCADTSAQTNAWAGSQSCRPCHGDFYKLWSNSFHGLAMQPYTPELARTRLTSQKSEIVAGTNRFVADVEKGLVLERTPKSECAYKIVQALGGKNVFYFLTQLERGRLQVLPLAYDVRRGEWFDTTVSALRHFRERGDEALYWKDRALTFNTSCYSCHVSQLAKNYDLASDVYSTTWAEPGINCETCHGPAAEHAGYFAAVSTNQAGHSVQGGPAATNGLGPVGLKLISMRALSLEQRNDTCAPCHARMSPLTPTFSPGERYFDHFDLVAFENEDFYPDGRDLGENYTYTLWRHSPCATSGKLECMHCHTSSGRYRFATPAQANDACLPCHAERVKNASGHTHHELGSAGNWCVSCHMPMTEFARMRRSDHSMRPPTPATTLQYGSPNACNLCHTNHDAGWADRQVRQWHKRDYQKPVLERAALIVAGRKSDVRKLPEILAYLGRPDREEIQTVSLVRLLETCEANEKWPVLRRLAEDRSPLVRSAVAEALGQRPDSLNVAILVAASRDAYRLVRIQAGVALARLGEENWPEAGRNGVRAAVSEAIDSLKSRQDDMASHFSLANLLMARGQLSAAIVEFETASRLQPDALPIYLNMALAYNAAGQNDKAEASLRRALQLESTNAAVQLNLGMLLAEMDRLSEAEQAFRAAYKSDPHSARAAYNLGVLLAKSRPDESLTWCARAAELRPEEPQYAYTHAFYLQQAGKVAEALTVLRAARQRQPEDESCAALERKLLQSLNPGTPR